MNVHHLDAILTCRRPTSLSPRREVISKTECKLRVEFDNEYRADAMLVFNAPLFAFVAAHILDEDALWHIKAENQPGSECEVRLTLDDLHIRPAGGARPQVIDITSCAEDLVYWLEHDAGLVGDPE